MIQKVQMSEKRRIEKSEARAYWPMVATALVVRLAVIPFLYRDWLDPFVLEHWAFGRVARSLVAGQGYGNVFANTGPTAVLAPVYVYVLTAVFKIFGVYTPGSIIAALALNSVFSALTCMPVSPGAPLLQPASGEMGRMGLGIFSIWNLLRSRLGLVYVSGYPVAGRPFPLVDHSRRIRKCVGVAGLRCARWRGSVDGAGGSSRHPSARPMDVLATVAQTEAMVYSDDGGSARSNSYHGAVVRT